MQRHVLLVRKEAQTRYPHINYQNQPTGDPQIDTKNASTDAFGNQGQPGQFGEEGQHGAVRGKGFGGGLAKGPDGAPQDEGQAQGKTPGGNYDEYRQNDSGSK